MAEKKYISDFPNLMTEWNWEKNNETGLDPKTLTCGSGKKAWWICSLGHEWQVTVKHRTNKRGCPYCSNQKILSGYNDLSTTNPILAAEWDFEKNGCLLPTMISENSGKKVWWKCNDCKHSWEARIADRSRGRDCSYCSGHKVLTGYNDLATLKPDIAKEWDAENNGDFLPTMVSAGSEKSVWWKCSICGHKWKSRIVDRSRGRGCPNCKKKRLSIIKSTPKEGNSLFDVNPYLASEWHPTKNGKLTPKDVNPSSKYDVWWLCQAGYEWQDSINHRSNGRGCPFCHKGMKTSYPEQCIYFYVKKLCSDTINRYRENNKEIDVFIPSLNLGIEYDGIYWHSNNKITKEREKDNYFLSRGIKIIRIKECSNSNDNLKAEENVIYYYNDYQSSNLEAVIKMLIETCK